ncbi:MAG: hypothetical protein BGO12_02280 [Verrucomicrobia bacterium 61-8]|nr:hypothetical protein [Verrucomicrobiota bacterium]OJV05506.1 MAG: hypothetical protein BGO12_02280 [Verrucomicrobia bacterium 61-8]
MCNIGTSTISYDAVQGVRISRDPIAEEGGINLYAYVNNDPINYYDPDGRNIASPIVTGQQLSF